MNPLKSNHWDSFEFLATHFAEDSEGMEVLTAVSAAAASKVRDSILCMDYVANFAISAASPEQQRIITLEQGYHFFLTGITVCQLTGAALKSAFMSIRDDRKEEELNGGPVVLTQPAGNKSFYPVDCNFGPGRSTLGGAAASIAGLLTEPRQVFRYLGDRGILRTNMKLEDGDTDTKTFCVIFSGWKISIEGLK